MWDRRHERFVEFEPYRREWPVELDELADIEDEDDEAAARGLMIGCAAGVVLWLGLVAVWRWPWLRGPTASVGIVFVILGGLLALHTYVVEPYRRRHADSRIVDWLRKAGL